jgi:hypothetical protein
MPELTQLLEESGLGIGVLEVETLALRFAVALAIGVVIAVRPWRRLMRRPLPRAEMVQAQILLCVAAAIITIVIGDSLAKAFGLVGLGSFVRFRSGLKDPREAAVLFLVIGLGMACGHGSLGLAAAGAVFATLLLAGLDLFRVPDVAPAAADGPAPPDAAPEVRPDDARAVAMGPKAVG